MQLRLSDYLVVSHRGGSGYIAISDSGAPIQDNRKPNYGYQYYAVVNNPGKCVNLREAASQRMISENNGRVVYATSASRGKDAKQT